MMIIKNKVMIKLRHMLLIINNSLHINSLFMHMNLMKIN